MTTKDDKKFWQFLRSGLRKLSQRWPTIYSVLADAKRPYVGDNPRQKVCYECAECGGTFSSKEVAVDHIEDCGSLKCKEDVAGFIERLFCAKEGLQVLCDTCHGYKSYMTKHSCTLEEAKLEKDFIIPFKKVSADIQKATLLKLNISVTFLSTAAKRIDAYRKYLKEQESNGN